MKQFSLFFILMIFSTAAFAELRTMTFYKKVNLDTNKRKEELSIPGAESFSTSSFSIKDESIVIKVGKQTYTIAHLEDILEREVIENNTKYQWYATKIDITVVKEKEDMRLKNRALYLTGSILLPNAGINPNAQFWKNAAELKLEDGTILCLNDDVIKGKKKVSEGSCF
jgi:hypothetical protein